MATSNSIPIYTSLTDAAPSVVLTAAHCLYNPRTRALLQPVSLHVLFGFERDSYCRHLLVARYRLGLGFMPGLRQPQSGDWALLYWPRACLRSRCRSILARSQLLLVDPDCHVRWQTAPSISSTIARPPSGLAAGRCSQSRTEIGRSSASISPPALR